MDISSLNAFLHATSKPVQSNAQNCFNRLPQVMNQLIVQCLFPVRQADESPMYRFMRAQILQSRQASYHGVLQILYQGCPPADAQADIEWKNGIDHACIEVQRVIARNLFSDFCRHPRFFLCDDRRYFFSPSPTFNQFPFITLLQRISHSIARHYNELNPDERRFISFLQGLQGLHGPQEESRDQEILISLFKNDFLAGFRLTDHADMRLLLANPELHVHMEERIRHIAEQPIIPDQRPQQNVPVPSKKIRLLAGCVAIASVIYSVCRAVYFVFRAILPVFLLSICAIVWVVAVACFAKSIVHISMQMPIFLKGVAHTLLETSTTRFQKVSLIAAPIFVAIALAGMVFICGSVIYLTVDLIRMSRQDLLARVRRIPSDIKMELCSVRGMLRSLIKQRTQLAQWILLRRRTPAAQA